MISSYDLVFKSFNLPIDPFLRKTLNARFSGEYCPDDSRPHRLNFFNFSFSIDAKVFASL